VYHRLCRQCDLDSRSALIFDLKDAGDETSQGKPWILLEGKAALRLVTLALIFVGDDEDMITWVDDARQASATAYPTPEGPPMMRMALLASLLYFSPFFELRFAQRTLLKRSS